MDRILDWVVPGAGKRHRDFWALRQVSFSIPKGRSVGIIGANGAGKSTLLKLISGTAKPTSGEVRVQGKIAALLELGMGFHAEFTGRQNIRMNGKLLGLTDDELDERIPKIIAFSELGDFIDQPLRTYSSGMYVRLGFSVVASVEPDILIVDEALSVGDLHFQQKCIRRIREFHEQGTTLLFVSHDPGAVKLLCEEAILLDEGEAVSRGEPDEILDHYNALIAKKSVKGSGFHMTRAASPQRKAGVRHSGSFMAMIVEAGLLDEKGEKVSAIVSGQEVCVYIRVFFLGETKNPTIGFMIKDRLGMEVFGTNTFMLGEKTGDFKAGETLEAFFKLQADIGAGEYSLTAAAHTLDFHIHECYDWADKIFIFTVVPSTDYRFAGIAKLHPEFSHKIKSVSESEAWNLLEDLFHDAGTSLTVGPQSQRFLCKGWYEPEAAEQGHLRWTDKDFYFFLRMDGSCLAIDMACPKPDIAEKPISADFFAKGVKFHSLVIDRPDPQVLRIPLPEHGKGMLTLFHVALSEVWTPADYSDSTDFRRIGIVVRKIWTE